MPRTSRRTPQAVREKISAALKRHYAAHPMTDEHKAAIGDSLKAYWATIPIDAQSAEHAYNVEEKNLREWKD